ncbi:UNVERIFIED_ORG: hypothetical protein BDK47_11832 [Anoxybacillus amylolyticus]
MEGILERVSFNEEQTNELLSNLKKEGLIVGLEDLAKYLRQKGLIVKEHVGRKRNYIELTPQLFGVDFHRSETLKQFFSEHLKMGKIQFIPDSDEKKLKSIESSLRMARKRASIGYDHSYMTIDAYNEFLLTFEEKKQKYFEARDLILAKWESLVSNFKKVLRSTLEELGALDREELFAMICAKLPTKEEYKESFYMTLTVKAFPVAENLEMFDEKIRREIEKGMQGEALRVMYEIVGNALNDAFLCISNMMKSVHEHGSIQNKTVSGLRTTAKRLAEKNLFHNDKIDSIRESMVQLSHEKNSDVLLSEGECLLAFIYGYAQELGVDRLLDIEQSPLSKQELAEMYRFLE